MKLNEIVSPEEKARKAAHAATLADIISKIKADCQPYLNQAGVKCLFRGMKKAPGFIRQSVRSDRKPTDSSKFVHNEMDKWFEKKFGFRARSNAVFATSLFRLATSYSGPYGGAFIVFPIGDFEFVWSPKIYDLYFSTNDVAFDKNDDRYPDDVLAPKIEQMLENGDYKNNDLAAAIASENEVMISCKEYYAYWVETKAEGTAFMKKLMK